MPSLFPIQSTFDGGEVSPRLLGRVDTEMYRKALALCRNFQPMPQGSLLMRAGSVQVALWPEGNCPRIFPFRRLGVADDLVLAVGDSKVRIFDRTTGVMTVHTNLVTNGTFDGGLSGWSLGIGDNWEAGMMKIPIGLNGLANARSQAVTTTPGTVYTLTFRVKSTHATADATSDLVFHVGTTEGEMSPAVTFAEANTFYTKTFTWTAAGASSLVSFWSTCPDTADPAAFYVDDVTVSAVGDIGVTELPAPWSNGQLDDVQCSPDRSKNRVVFSHPNVVPTKVDNPQVGIWGCNASVFKDPPSLWGGSNWPSAVEWGFQGRTWWAATPNEPNELWGSKTGSPFEFTDGVDADDPIDVLLSTKGTIEWLMGHHTLLAGSEVGEHAITGAGGVIAPGSLNVSDESAFGSASIQAQHIGDQVAFVTSDRRHVRVLTYSLQENGWLSKALTWIADHLTVALIREIHWAKSPVPTLIVLMQDGSIAACTYDRSEKVLAWWRIDIGAPVRSCCVANTSNGSELWLSTMRGGFATLERMPLHEVGVKFLDCSMSGQISGGLLGFAPAGLAGQMVSVIVDGARREPRLVEWINNSGPYVRFDPGDEGLQYTVGRAISAVATTLPLEGGNPAGTSQGFKVHYTDLSVRLNNSAAPIVEGTRAGPGRPFSTPLDTVESLVTDDLKVKSVHADQGGQITIEQDLPFRTEICALYVQAHISKV